MTIYVDTTELVDGDGTQPTPYNTLTSVPSFDGEPVLIKRGSNENLAGTIFMGVDLPLIMVGAYGDVADPLPILSAWKNDLVSGSWIEISPNVWLFTFSDSAFNEPFLLGTNTLENFGIRKRFVENPQIQVAVAAVIVGNPTQIQAFPHGVEDGQYVYLSEIVNTGAGPDINGYFQVTLVNVNIFTINVDTTGGGPYTGGRILPMDHANLPSADGEWDNWKGAAGHSAALILYAVGNPDTYYSDVFYARSNDAPFTFFRNTGVVEFTELDFAYCSRPWSPGTGSGSVSTNGSVWAHECIFRESYYGPYVLSPTSSPQFWSDGTLVEYNHIYNIRATGILGGDFMINSHIHHNLVHDCCLSVSNGGVYFGNNFSPVGEENYIYLNEIHDVIAGNYWPTDGGGIMLDSDCDNCIVAWNYLHDMELALKDNTASNPVWTGNLVAHCDLGLVIGDSEGKLGIDVKATDNVFAFCGNDLIQNSGIINKDRVVSVNSAAGDDTSVVDLKNNIFVGSDDTVSIGIAIASNFALSESVLIEDHNCFHALSVKMILNGVDVSTTIDATDVTGDPLFIDDASDYNLQVLSPCRDVGVNHWGNKPRASGYYGEPKPDVKGTIDIGFQSTWNLKHPFNK